MHTLSAVQGQKGHEVVVLQPHPQPSSVGERVSVLSVGRPVRHSVDRFRFGVKAGRVFLRLHRQKAFDLLHVHGDIIEGVALALAARAVDVPMLLTIHGRLSRRWWHRALTSLLARMIPAIVVVSAEIKADLVGLGYAPDRVHVVSSGVVLADYRGSMDARRRIREQYGLCDEEVLAIFVGALEPLKGPEILLDAARELNGLVRVFVVGEGPLESGIRRAASQIPSVTVIGAIARSGVSEYLGAADLFVLPSIDLPGKGEGTPTALIEALAAGLPAVVSDSGGGKDLVRRGPCGVVVPQGDAGALAATLRALARDPDRRRRLADQARHAVADKDWASIAQDVEQVYTLVCTRGRRAS